MKIACLRMLLERPAPRHIGRRALLLGAAGCAVLPGAGLAQAPRPTVAADYGRLIDIAGRQRMLSQRIVKAYCQVGLATMTEVSQSQLTDAVRRFEIQLAELRRDAPPTARAALERVRAPWQRFRRVATGPVTRDGARRLAAQSEAVLQAAQEVVVLLQDSAGTSYARLVNISGRQRMLSQRLAKLYMLRAWGLDTPSQRDQMDTTAHEFDGALEALRAAPENTQEIGAALDAVAQEWEWFKAALALQGAESYAIVVADASESILRGMETVTAKYAELARR